MKFASRVLAIASFLIFAISACGVSATPAPAATSVEPRRIPGEIPPTLAPGDPCLNDYIPVRQRAYWVYASTGSPLGNYGFTKGLGMDAAYPGGFGYRVLTTEGIPFREQWLCTPDGFVAQSMTMTESSSLLALNKYPEIKITNIVGISFPPTLQPGAQWTYSYDVQGVKKAADETVIDWMTGKAAFAYSVKGMESVSVPAGIFEAMAIIVESTFYITTNDAAGTDTISSTSAYTVWYAPGVGWVKSSGSGKLGGLEFFETIELQSYTIP